MRGDARDTRVQPHPRYTTEELMATIMAREVSDGDQAAVGTISAIPAAGVLLAYFSHAPTRRPIIINSDDWWPFRHGSKEFYDFAQRGRVDVFFLSGGQIDHFGNLNTVAVGDPARPTIRLPGGAGSAMLYYLPKRVIVFRGEHSPRIFVERVDVVSSPGSSAPTVARPGGPTLVVTPLCLFQFDPDARRLRLHSLHPGVSEAEVRRSTGFSVDPVADLRVTAPPTSAELHVLRTRVKAELAKIYPVFSRTAFGTE